MKGQIREKNISSNFEKCYVNSIERLAEINTFTATKDHILATIIKGQIYKVEIRKDNKVNVDQLQQTTRGETALELW